MELAKNCALFLQNCWREPPIPDKERVLLTPFNQWRKYRNFPIKIVLHLLIVVFVTVQALMLSTEFIPYGSANQACFQTTFLLEEYRDGIFSVYDFLDVLRSTVDNYYAFPEYSVNRYDHIIDADTGLPVPIMMTVTRYQSLDGPFWNHTIHDPTHKIDDDDFEGDFSLVTNKFELDADNALGAFDISLDDGGKKLLDMFYFVTSVRLDFSFRTINVGPLAVLPVMWDITLYFDINGGMIDFSILVQFRVSNTAGLSGYDIFTSLTVMLLVLSVASLLLSVQALYHNLRVFQRVKRSYKQLSRYSLASDTFPNWQTIPFSAKSSFFCMWSAFNTFGCLCIVVSCLLGLSAEFGFATSAEYYVVYGFGCLLVSCNMLRYFEYNKKFYVHISTLRNASTHILRFVISVTPVYWGYAIFGVLNFGPYNWRFANLDEASVTLFALLTGDDIHDTFKDIVDGGYPLPIVSRIYIYSFCIIFITTVLNVFIFIIEDSYRVAKHHNLYKDQEHMPRHLLVDGMAVPVVSSGREVLQVIFRNLYTWSERIEANPGIFDAVPDNGLEELQEVCLQVPENPSSQPAIAPFASHLQDEALLDRAAQVSKEDRERRKRRRPRSVSTQLPTVTSMDVAALDLSSSSGAVPKTRRPSASDEIRMTASPSVTSDESDAEESSGLLGKSESGNFLDVASAARMRRKERKVERPEGTLSLSVPSLGSESLPPADASARPPLDSSARSTAATAPQDSASLLSMLQTELVAQKAAFEHRFRIQEQELQKIRLEHHKALANILHLCQALEPMLPPSAHVPTTVVDEDEEPQS
mmetsp:Transcript_12988/g.51805  ORF Transcript_12988/g.51805 Transcript_12988/m.51805 type:complete len:812 (+) Transcript_12988:179-2614(+)